MVRADSQQSLSIQLEFVPEDMATVNMAEIADFNKAKNEMIAVLRQNADGQYTLQPERIGTKAEPVTFIVLLTTAIHFLHQNSDLIQDTIGSLTLFLQSLQMVSDHRNQKGQQEVAPVKITVEIDGKPVTVEATKVDEAINAIKQLQAIPHDAKIKVKIPKHGKR